MTSKNLTASNFASKSGSVSKLNMAAIADWTEAKQELGSDRGDSDSEIGSESESFLAKGAFLLTPSYELTMEKASAICEKMNFKFPFSLTKTATGILFKFASPEDYQAVFKKGFHKVTGVRFYKKIAIPCRPQKTFVIYVQEIPEEIPEEDIRHALYKLNSVVEVTRITGPAPEGPKPKIDTGAAASKPDSKQQPSGGTSSSVPPASSNEVPVSSLPPPAVRITLANMEEANYLLQNGLDFYGATYFPTETVCQTSMPKEAIKRVGNRSKIFESLSANVRTGDSLPVFDATGFQKIAPPTNKVIRPGNFDQFGLGKK